MEVYAGQSYALLMLNVRQSLNFASRPQPALNFVAINNAQTMLIAQKTLVMSVTPLPLNANLLPAMLVVYVLPAESVMLLQENVLLHASITTATTQTISAYQVFVKEGYALLALNALGFLNAKMVPV